MGDAGVKAGLAVVGAEAAVAGAVVAAPAVISAVSSTASQVITTVNTVSTQAYVAGSTALTAAGTAINNAAAAVRKRIARRDSAGNIYYYMEDFLGSSRVIFAAATSTVCYDADFYPGVYPEGRRRSGERAYTNTCPQNYKFEGKERDAETGNDDFGARYYSPSLGRWLSADWSAIPTPVPYANLTNPQTLNLYAMVSDNPETFADLDGHVGELTPDPPSDKCGVCGANTNDDDPKENQPAEKRQPPPWPAQPLNPFEGCSPGTPVCGQAQTQSDQGTVGEKAKEFGSGVWDTTGRPIVDTVKHPIQTAKDTKATIEILIDPSSHGWQLLDAAWGLKQWTTKIYSGDPRAIGQYVGLIISLEITRRAALGREIKIGDNFRIAPAGNRTDHPLGKYPHYHRRIVGPDGKTVPGGSMKWHRPWEP